MIDAGELIACLSERPVSMEARSAAFFRGIDIAHAMAGLTELQSYLLRVKYADQRTWIKDLDRRTWMAIVDMWVDNKWRYPKERKGQEFARNMGRLALCESIWPHTCLRCGGWGNDIHQGKITPCPSCNGSGRSIPNSSIRSHYMGMEESLWEAHWADYYKQIQKMLEDEESYGLGKMVRRLFAA